MLHTVVAIDSACYLHSMPKSLSKRDLIRLSVFSLVFMLAAFMLAIDAASARASTIDPLSEGPIPLSAKNIEMARKSYKDGMIYTDDDCALQPTDIRDTEVPLSQLPENVCRGRSQELVYLASRRALVACLEDTTQFAMKISVGSEGLGKTRKGTRKSPFGTYWLGVPRRSKYFGIFIPLGYPNKSEIAKGYTGSAIGIHGPMRFLTCLPEVSLKREWTAGCLALGRDSQLIQLSEWILGNWPVKISITRD